MLLSTIVACTRCLHHFFTTIVQLIEVTLRGPNMAEGQTLVCHIDHPTKHFFAQAPNMRATGGGVDSLYRHTLSDPNRDDLHMAST